MDYHGGLLAGRVPMPGRFHEGKPIKGFKIDWDPGGFEGEKLWPSALTLADEMERSVAVVNNRAIDLGCGVGLSGLAAIRAGFKVTMLDCNPKAIVRAHCNLDNNQLNGLVVEGSFGMYEAEYDWIFGSDMLYGITNPRTVADFIDRCWTRRGTVIFTDPVRDDGRHFEMALESHSLGCLRREVKGEYEGHFWVTTLYTVFCK